MSQWDKLLDRVKRLSPDGIQDILKFGIAFSGKKVSVKTK